MLRKYESSIEGLEAARAVALAAVGVDPENKNALEEVVAYSGLIERAKCEMAELPAEPLTGCVCMSYLAGIGGWVSTRYNLADGTATSGTSPPGSINPSDVDGQALGAPQIRYAGCPDAKYVASGGRVYMVGGDKNDEHAREREAIDAAMCGNVSVMDPLTWRWKLVTHLPFTGVVRSAAIMNGNLYVAVGDEPLLHVWNIDDGEWTTLTVGVAPVSRMFKVSGSIVTAGMCDIGVISNVGAPTWLPIASFERIRSIVTMMRYEEAAPPATVWV
jgi:hypothetical protein